MQNLMTHFELSVTILSRVARFQFLRKLEFFVVTPFPVLIFYPWPEYYKKLKKIKIKHTDISTKDPAFLAHAFV